MTNSDIFAGRFSNLSFDGVVCSRKSMDQIQQDTRFSVVKKCQCCLVKQLDYIFTFFFFGNFLRLYLSYPVFLVCLFSAVLCFLSVSSLGWSSVNCLPVVMSLSHTQACHCGEMTGNPAMRISPFLQKPQACTANLDKKAFQTKHFIKHMITLPVRLLYGDMI